MNTKRKYEHNPIVEERMFAMDVESLKQYDNQFKKAYETGEKYEFTIKLSDIIEICPRHKQEREQYRRGDPLGGALEKQRAETLVN